ncbi:DUF6879 family protein [Streptacidiphilus neutrinimicus]|uniref:DUF6879 family protein n=1 Tax=Streptacidiphilus neutrinimicus TaxID=105420 RepID=UPI0005A7FB65|nr:DUF6879 family protein [Streptacidiphilus neutrinimicus]
MQPNWSDLIGSASEYARHLELRDRYLVPDEEAEFQTWRADGTLDVDPDGDGWRGWTGIVRSASSRGCAVQRLRIVSEPVTEYTRWLHAITAANVAAGEQVRWLPRAMARDLLIPAEDFWLLDDRLVAFNELDGDGNSHGWDVRDDPALAVRMCVAWSELWDRAIPHEKYEVH